MRKKLDPRIRTLIENGVLLRHRSLFVIIGDNSRDQIVNLHQILSKARVRAKPSVLWCYKKELGFSSHHKKRWKDIKKQQSQGKYDKIIEEPFELFLSSTNIRFCFYKETNKILGNTFGVCILQDFESITPNLLARTIETVEGGGFIIIILKTLTSLKQLYTMVMDVHARYRTEAHKDIVCRFNERFLLSLSKAESCICVDDELNILQISSKIKDIQKIKLKPVTSSSSENEGVEYGSCDGNYGEMSKKLSSLKNKYKDHIPLGALVGQTVTLDQARCIEKSFNLIKEKWFNTTVTITAARGRGKSAALGLILASAVYTNFANIFVTSPSPENVTTLFEFFLKGIKSLGFVEHKDFEIIRSVNQDYYNSVVRVNIFRKHRQTIQYIKPTDYHYLVQAELLIIDECAAIPLPIVKKLLGPYLIFLSSTINGYEGTGRSLALKLIKELRVQSQGAINITKNDEYSENLSLTTNSRLLREITLDEPIRYASNDPIEHFLTNLLCLDCVGQEHRIIHGTPSPSDCDLYFIDRDALFSYHPASENFLKKIMSLFVSSHYKNTPNDLQMLSDAPAHLLFVLLGPIKDSTVVPDILCAIQLALEGEISTARVNETLGRGARASGDLIPWTISQQFQDNNFAKLMGGRIVRIAVHPDVQHMGYGSCALNLLYKYFMGEFVDLRENTDKQEQNIKQKLKQKQKQKEKEKEKEKYTNDNNNNILTENIQPRKNIPPLLLPLTERCHEPLKWLGTSFGITDELFRFWEKNAYTPIYTRLTANDLTGEHTCIMLRDIDIEENENQTSSSDNTTLSTNIWLESFYKDFQNRFLSLLSYQFRSMSLSLTLSLITRSSSKQLVLSDKEQKQKKEQEQVNKNKTNIIDYDEIHYLFSHYDLQRLDAYSRNQVDYHLILDLIPIIARLYFSGKIPYSSVNLTFIQRAILMGIGLQHKSLNELEIEINNLNPNKNKNAINSNRITVSQILGLFNTIMRKINSFFNQIESKGVEKELGLKKEDGKMKNNIGKVKLDEDMNIDRLQSTLIHEKQKHEKRTRVNDNLKKSKKFKK